MSRRSCASSRLVRLLSKVGTTPYPCAHTSAKPIRSVAFRHTVKSPDAPSTNPRAAGGGRSNKKEYPDELRGLFTTRFIPANPVELLDYPGQELLFISAREHLADGAEEEVKEPAQEEEKEYKEEEKKSKDPDEAVFKTVFAELHLYKNKKEAPGIKALEGQWA